VEIAEAEVDVGVEVALGVEEGRIRLEVVSSRKAGPWCDVGTFGTSRVSGSKAEVPGGAAAGMPLLWVDAGVLVGCTPSITSVILAIGSEASVAESSDSLASAMLVLSSFSSCLHCNFVVQVPSAL
jgi:hypothetical protein